jgi:prevent-host-death family protein
VRTINALDFRKKLGSTIDEVYEKKTPIVISRANKPMVVIIPFEDYNELLAEKDREKRLQLASSRIDQWRKKYGKQLKDTNSVEVIRQLREEK